MSEFIFKSAVFRKRHDTVQAMLLAAEIYREEAIDVALAEDWKKWDETEGERLRKRAADNTKYAEEKAEEDAKKAKRVEETQEQRQAMQDKVTAEHDASTKKYAESGFLYQLFHTVELRGHREKRMFHAAGWSRTTGDWMPPIDKTESEEDAYDRIYLSPSRRLDWWIRMPVPEPQREHYTNQFTVFLRRLNPLSDALTIGASEVRLDDSMMKTFLAAEKESAEYIKENADAD